LCDKRNYIVSRQERHLCIFKFQKNGKYKKKGFIFHLKKDGFLFKNSYNLREGEKEREEGKKKLNRKEKK